MSLVYVQIGASDLSHVINRAARISELGSLLANRQRTTILCLAAEIPGMTLTAYATLLDVDFCSLWYHVGRLVELGLVTCERHGRYRRVFLAGDETIVLIARLSALVAELAAKAGTP